MRKTLLEKCEEVISYTPWPFARNNLTTAKIFNDLLQFHGAEQVAYCEAFDRPFIKALRVRNDTDLPLLARQYSSARGLLLDSYQKGVPGGTGETFNWDLIPPSLRTQIILAGGH